MSEERAKVRGHEYALVAQLLTPFEAGTREPKSKSSGGKTEAVPILKATFGTARIYDLAVESERLELATRAQVERSWIEAKATGDARLIAKVERALRRYDTDAKYYWSKPVEGYVVDDPDPKPGRWYTARHPFTFARLAVEPKAKVAKAKAPTISYREGLLADSD